ncbi:hypothetical protein MMC28_007468 [Mycoblastus sanguinarius]|nr:hypothetical protein [Mycoblastus sanguinarius]
MEQHANKKRRTSSYLSQTPGGVTNSDGNSSGGIPAQARTALTGPKKSRGSPTQVATSPASRNAKSESIKQSSQLSVEVGASEPPADPSSGGSQRPSHDGSQADACDAAADRGAAELNQGPHGIKRVNNGRPKKFSVSLQMTSLQKAIWESAKLKIDYLTEFEDPFAFSGQATSRAKEIWSEFHISSSSEDEVEISYEGLVEMKQPRWFQQDLIYQIIRHRYLSSEKRRGSYDPTLINKIDSNIICWAATLCYFSVYKWASGELRKEGFTQVWYDDVSTRQKNGWQKLAPRECKKIEEGYRIRLRKDRNQGESNENVKEPRNRESAIGDQMVDGSTTASPSTSLIGKSRETPETSTSSQSA